MQVEHSKKLERLLQDRRGFTLREVYEVFGCSRKASQWVIHGIKQGVLRRYSRRGSELLAVYRAAT